MWKAMALCSVAFATGCLSVEDVELDTVEQRASVYQWADEEKLDQYIRGQEFMGIAQVNDMLVAASTNAYTNEIDIWYMIPQFDGWAHGRTLPQRAERGLTMAVHDDRLVLIYKPEDENRFMMMRSRTQGGVWSTPVTAGAGINGSTILSAPSIVAKDGSLFLAYCLRRSNGDHVRIDRLRDGTWTNVHSHPTTGARCKTASLGVVNGVLLYLAYNEESSSTGTWYMKESWSSTGTGWTPPHDTGMKSKKQVSVVTCGGMTHLVHGGYSNHQDIWWTYFDNGPWQPDVKIPGGFSVGGTALACYNNRTIMVHSGYAAYLMWSEFGP